MTYVYDFPKASIALTADALDEALRIGRELDEALRTTLGVRAEGFVSVGQPTPRYEDGSYVTEPRDMAPSLTEAAAVMAAVETYRRARDLPGGDMADMPLILEELKVSIAKLEHVTTIEASV